MALITITDSMAFSKRKESMIEIAAGPGKTGYKMTFTAVSRKITLNMIWICGGKVIFLVAIITFNTERFKLQQGS
jgi:hypothetical protein